MSCNSAAPLGQNSHVAGSTNTDTSSTGHTATRCMHKVQSAISTRPLLLFANTSTLHALHVSVTNRSTCFTHKLILSTNLLPTHPLSLDILHHVSLCSTMPKPALVPLSCTLRQRDLHSKAKIWTKPWPTLTCNRNYTNIAHNTLFIFVDSCATT